MTRTRILDATERLLTDKSSLDSKVAEIAGEAGVSPSLVIQYFKTKEDLVFETIVHWVKRLTPEQYNRFLDPSEKLTLDDFFKFALAHDLQFSHVTADVMSLSWRWSAEGEQRFLQALAPRRAALRRLIEAALAPASPPPETDEAASVLYAGVLRRAIVEGWSVERARAELSVQIDLLLRGLR